jgi:phosphatidate cytidylyltransferase
LSDRFASLPKRVGVAVIAIPMILLLAYEGGYYFFFLVVTISSLSLFEFYTLAEQRGVFPQKSVGLIFGVLINLAFIYDRVQLGVLKLSESYGFTPSMFSLHQFLLFVILIFLVVVALVELFRTRGSAIQNAAVTVLGVVLIALFFGTLIQTRELFPFGFPVSKFFPHAIATDVERAQINKWGGFTIIAIFATIWVCDTAAYFGGLTLGKHKLFERVSPKKTWEGALFGFVFSVLTMVVARNLALQYMSIGNAVVIGMIIGCFGQLGDLVESRFKRDAGVKDSSSIIPGHGGVYDRFDSLVFVSPIVYLYIDFVILS